MTCMTRQPNDSEMGLNLLADSKFRAPKIFYSTPIQNSDTRNDEVQLRKKIKASAG